MGFRRKISFSWCCSHRWASSSSVNHTNAEFELSRWASHYRARPVPHVGRQRNHYQQTNQIDEQNIFIQSEKKSVLLCFSKKKKMFFHPPLLIPLYSRILGRGVRWFVGVPLGAKVVALETHGKINTKKKWKKSNPDKYSRMAITRGDCAEWGSEDGECASEAGVVTMAWKPIKTTTGIGSCV